MNDVVPTDLISPVHGAPACVLAKMAVDLVNNIDVARDHIRVQHDRMGKLKRVYDGLTGQGAKRQAEVNNAVTDSLGAALSWLMELNDSVTRSNLALVKVQTRVATLQAHVASLTDYSLDTRRQLEDLGNAFDARCGLLAQELVRVDFEQRAERQLEQVFNKWAAGRFGSLGPARQFYAVLEDLRWGAFGDYCRAQDTTTRRGFLDDLINRAIRQLVIDSGTAAPTFRLPVGAWISPPASTGKQPDQGDVLSYLGDWSVPEEHPFVFSVSQAPTVLPLLLPRICSAERVGEALVSEVFGWAA